MPVKSLEEMVECVVMQRSRWHLRMSQRCSDADIIKLRCAAQEELGVCLPERYLDLLRLHDGILENGLQFYASRPLEVPDVDGSYFLSGIIEANKSFRADREGYDRLVVFAVESLYVHALDADSGKYILLAHDDQ